MLIGVNHQARICQILSFVRREIERGAGGAAQTPDLEQAGRRLIMPDVSLVSRLTVAYRELQSFLGSHKHQSVYNPEPSVGLSTGFVKVFTRSDHIQRFARTARPAVFLGGGVLKRLYYSLDRLWCDSKAEHYVRWLPRRGSSRVSGRKGCEMMSKSG